MAKKKKIIRRDTDHSQIKTDPKAKTQNAEPEKPRIPERIREKDSGFGVIKVVVGAIVILVLGSTVLFNKVGGGRESHRGDKSPGEPCNETVECIKGSLCYIYQEQGKQCMQTCSDGACPSGYTCVGAASQKQRKGIRITDVCVRNANP